VSYRIRLSSKMELPSSELREPFGKNREERRHIYSRFFRFGLTRFVRSSEGRTRLPLTTVSP
jgi:hypothetical protein